MRHFLSQLNPPRAADGLPLISMARIGKIQEQISTGALYALKSKCEDAERRGFSFTKRFWWEIKPRNEEKRAA